MNNLYIERPPRPQARRQQEYLLLPSRTNYDAYKKYSVRDAGFGAAVRICVRSEYRHITMAAQLIVAPPILEEHGSQILPFCERMYAAIAMS